jgi:hypothetical protein
MSIELLQWALLLGLGAAIFYLMVELKAMQKSTHQITYVNPFADKKNPQSFQTIDQELEKELNKEFFDNIN